MTSIRGDLELERDGARHFPGAFNVDRLSQALAHLPSDQPGIRLTKGATPAGLGPATAIAREVLGEEARPVRAVLFDKTPATNWKLGWHQDRTVVVMARRDVVGYGPWSVKAGLQHVEPPFEVLEAMITLRLHLDAVDADNAPLMIAPGSHRRGRIPEGEVRRTVEACGVATCLAQAGDIWLYATPILHASDAAASPSRRRVLQIDYSARDLPGGLEWLGV